MIAITNSRTSLCRQQSCIQINQFISPNSLRFHKCHSTPAPVHRQGGANKRHPSSNHSSLNTTQTTDTFSDQSDHEVNASRQTGQKKLIDSPTLPTAAGKRHQQRRVIRNTTTVLHRRKPRKISRHTITRHINYSLSTAACCFSKLSSLLDRTNQIGVTQ